MAARTVKRSLDQDPQLTFQSPAAFEKWLKRNHSTTSGVWLRIAKKAAQEKTVTYPEALDLALCWGWIDGIRRPLDEVAFLQRFTPRGPRSKWSKVNQAKVAALVEAQRMQAPGLAEVERAKADGRWAAAYEPPSRAQPPPAFFEALAQNAKAAAFYATLNAANRFAVAYRLGATKRPETQERNIEKFVALFARGKPLF